MRPDQLVVSPTRRTSPWQDMRRDLPIGRADDKAQERSVETVSDKCEKSVYGRGIVVSRLCKMKMTPEPQQLATENELYPRRALLTSRTARIFYI
jgi:hypothetical protein